MIETTVKISGMVCGMCEAHLNDAIRAALPVRKVRSSRRKGETVILSDAPLDRRRLEETVLSAGYVMLSASEEPARKKPLLAGLLKRKA